MIVAAIRFKTVDVTWAHLSAFLCIIILIIIIILILLSLDHGTVVVASDP